MNWYRKSSRPSVVRNKDKNSGVLMLEVYKAGHRKLDIAQLLERGFVKKYNRGGSIYRKPMNEVTDDDVAFLKKNNYHIYDYEYDDQVVPSIPQKLESEESKIISFDYDDTMTVSDYRDGIWRNPKHNNRRTPEGENFFQTPFRANEKHPFNIDIINRMKEYANSGHRVIITTARPKYTMEGKLHPRAREVYEVVEFYNLPVAKEDIYFTNEQPKGPLLQELGVARHYEDQQDQINSAEEHGVEIARVWHPLDYYLHQKEEQEKSLT
jgi:acid phosphatase class B